MSRTAAASAPTRIPTTTAATVSMCPPWRGFDYRGITAVLTPPLGLARPRPEPVLRPGLRRGQG